MASLIASFCWTLLAVGIYWLVRLFTLQAPRCLRRTLVVAMVAAACAGFFVCQCQQQTPRQAEKVTEQLLLWPDEVTVNGNLVWAVGREVNGGDKQNLVFRVPNRREQGRWGHLTHPVLLRAQGQRQPLLPATNDQQFDARRYYRGKWIYSELRAEEVHIERVVAPQSPLAICHFWRAQAHQAFTHLPDPLCAYADQLIIGYRGPTADWRAAVQKLGIIHLFCLSGMHVVLLCELLRRLLGYCHLTRETINAGLIILLPSYLILGGGSPSLLRAVIMAECRLLSPQLKMTALDGWSWSLIIGCCCDPLVLTNLGGQLSYLLSLLLQLIEAGELKTSFLLNLAGVPLILNKVYEIHLLSFLMSYLVSPLFAVLLFPGTIISALTYGWWPGVGQVFNQLLLAVHRLLIACAHLPGEVCFGKPPAVAVWALLILSLLLVERPTRQNVWRLATAYCLCFCWLHFPLSGEVTFVDVGQGDSIIVRTPLNRHTVMIDTGGRLVFRRPGWARVHVSRSQAEKTSINYLKSRGINRLDALFLSHSDADHIGDLPVVLTRLKVKRLYVPLGMENLPKFRHHLPAGTPVSILPVRSGDVCENLFQVVHPTRCGQGTNGDSQTLLGSFGGTNFLFTGDLDRQGERQVIKEYPHLRVDVLKLGHHGSRTASDPRFLDRIHPAIGIISAGRFNRYGHPHNVTIRHLKERGIRILSTQQYGMIRYRYFGNHGRWQTTLRGDELQWMLPPYSNS